MAEGPLLLYDGNCGFCQASVQFVLRHEHRHTLRFAPLQGTWGTQIRGRHPALRQVDSVVWVDDPGGPGERIRIRSEAALRVCRYLGGGWPVLSVAGVLPRPLRDWLYDLVARHRHTLMPAVVACALPAPEARARFLE